MDAYPKREKSKRVRSGAAAPPQLEGEGELLPAHTTTMKAACLGGFKASVRGTPAIRASAAPAVARGRGAALEVACKAKAGQELNGKWCRLTGKTANNGYSVSHSHIRTKRLQHVNLQVKRIFWPRGNRWVKIKLSAKGMKTVDKVGIEAAAKKAGIDLWKLPFQLAETDARKQWKKQQKEDGNVMLHGRVLPKDKRKMVNLEKLAKSDHPLAAECNALLGKLDLTGDAKQDRDLLNLRKLASSDHALAAEAKEVYDRQLNLGTILAEKHRQKNFAEANGYSS